jgi:curved DNA-binding protein CbpA
MSEEESHYKVLGVPPGSDYATVRGAYEKLIKRLDVSRFETNADKAEAERILARVNVAYDALRGKLDPTQNRFGKLEL